MLTFNPTRVTCCLTVMTLILFIMPIGFGFTNHDNFQRTTAAVSSIRQTTTLKAAGQSIELDGDENLKALFERAVVLQRSGATSEALEAYERFIKAGT